MAADPLANSGHFFGMTTFGATDCFFANAATTSYYPFHELPIESYLEVYHANILGDNDVARTLKVDGSQYILRSKLGAMLNTLLGRQASKTELQAWFTFCDFDRGCLMALEEYQAAVELLREFSAHPQRARQYQSFGAWRADHLKNRRVGWEAQQAYQEPLTASQTIGWHATKPHRPSAVEPHFALRTTDVTQKEGRNAATYYGYMTMI